MPLAVCSGTLALIVLDEGLVSLAYVIRDVSSARPSWKRRAACRGHDTNLWFPERGDADNGRTATAICAGCSVRQECAALAMGFSDNYVFGVCGGMSGPERRKARRREVARVIAD